MGGFPPKKATGSMNICLVNGHEIVLYFFLKYIFELNKGNFIFKKLPGHLLILQHEHLY
jgi:hypothetical protein